MEPYLNKCSVIGEIGMDSCWAKVPLDIQARAFVAQLDIAQKRNVPVILHTKGQEREIASVISNYSIPFLVHWYSSDQHLDLFLKKDCYFTVGPAIDVESAVREVARRVPLDRLLIETDGIAGIEWLRRKSLPLDEIPKSLRSTLATVAKIRNLDPDYLQHHVNSNFIRFSRASISQ
jgi:TatD DNase family protein